MKPNLHCTKCAFIALDAKDGMQHVRENSTHVVTGEGIVEGTTITISAEEHDV